MLRQIVSSHKISRHDSVKVRRATVALLGELIFTCTQNDEEDDIVGMTEISRLLWFLQLTRTRPFDTTPQRRYRMFWVDIVKPELSTRTT